MDNQYFVYNNVKYIVEYKKEFLYLYKEVSGKKEKLSIDEERKIKALLNSKYSYEYSSSVLNNIVFKNHGIEKQEYLINFLLWLEKIIPEDCRTNLYRNIVSLRTILNMDLSFTKSETYSTGSSTIAGYNTKINLLILDQNSLQDLWRMAQKTNNPQDFYSRHYAQTLLHELSHMASSYYDSQTGISCCGFDKHPAQDESDKNRGLTEGFTEVISMTGVPNTFDITSNYYIETCFINQLIQIIGYEPFIKSYFANLGTSLLENRLNGLINNPGKSYELFRNIELNFDIRELCSEQNVLGYIQSTLIDYLEARINSIIDNSTIEDISKLLQTYESAIITPEKLRMMHINPQGYYGVAESTVKFDELKRQCLLYFKDNKRNIA